MAESDKKNVGGRPRHGEGVKSAPLSIRTEQELRDRLEAAAIQNRRSLTQEVERRLLQSFETDPFNELDADVRDAVSQSVAARGDGTPIEEINHRLRQSFLVDNIFGSAETPRLLRTIGNAIDLIESRSRKRWWKDDDTWAAALQAIQIIMTDNAPTSVRPPEDYYDVKRQLSEGFDLFRKMRLAWKEYLHQHPEIDQRDEHIRAGGKYGDVAVDPEVERRAFEMQWDASELGEALDQAQEKLRRYEEPIADFHRAATREARDALDDGGLRFRFIPAVGEKEAGAENGQGDE